MKTKTLKILTLMLSIIITAMFITACQSKPDTETEIRISVLNGTTGFGMAKLINDSKNDKASLNYKFTVESDASNITAALVNKTVDIAALPTNAAANLYNTTNGGVKIVAINTLGVLYLMTNSEKITVSDFSELKGKTVYCPAQNPAFIFEYLCEKNGLKVGEDVIIDNSFAQPADLRTALASGQVDIAVLPEPMVTIAQSANDKLKVSLDLTAEWDKVAEPGSLAQGCIVARTEFIEEHKTELDKFLEEYKASVEFTVENPKEASEAIQSENIFTNAAVAEKAIPKCNICYVDGNEMKSSLDKFFTALYSVAPASIGNKVPDSGIYYTGE